MASHPRLRTLLVLGRISNLPTVWTNCLCGWLLGGGGSEWILLVLLLGSSLVYTGGMYLNDAFDAAFDRQYRRDRPIPSLQITETLVWQLGGGMLLAGGVILGALGWRTAIWSLLLLLSVLIYDAVHKAVALSPVVMAACRFFLFLAAASAGDDGVTGAALWSALALSGWIVGLSYVARRESAAGPMKWWPLAALAMPLILAIIVNDGRWRWGMLFWVLLVAVWIINCVRHSFSSRQRSLGRTVSGLLAGICLVDLLAVPPEPAPIIACLLGFGLARLAQRYIPAT